MFVLAIVSAIIIALYSGYINTDKGITGQSVTGNFKHKILTENEKISQCMSDKMCLDLSEVIYFEARSESVEGMVAVAFVVLNRINHPKRWGKTVEGVITQPDQFTYRWDGSMRKGFSELKAYRKVLTVAHDTLAGKLNNPIGSADHYKTLDAKPNWNYNKLIQVAVIGNHVFYQHK